MKLNVFFLALILSVHSAVSYAEQATIPTVSPTTPITQLLDSHGQLRVPDGFSGAIDARTHRMEIQGGGTPKFVPIKNGANIDDGVWSSFGGVRSGCNGQIYTLATASNGDVYVGGSFSACGDIPVNNIARYVPATHTWHALQAGGINGVNDFVAHISISGSNFYIAGGFDRAGTLPVRGIAMWNGAQWNAMGLNSFIGSGPQKFAVANGIVYAGGGFTQLNGQNIRYLAKWDGLSWSAVGSDSLNGPVYALAVSGNELYVGGEFTQVGNLIANHIARWNGSIWSNLGSGTNSSTVRDIAISGTDVYVGGSFSQLGGAPIRGIGRWNGSSWSALGTGLGNNAQVMKLFLDGSNIYVGGLFQQAYGAPANSIAQWNGSTWSGFTHSGGDGLSNAVDAITVSAGSLFVGGFFSSAVGNTEPNYIARWSGSAWEDLAPGTGNGVVGYISAMAYFNNELIVGGTFTEVGDVKANSIARWNGTRWAALIDGFQQNGVSGQVNALGVSGANLFVGGGFLFAGGVYAKSAARWDGSNWYRLGTETNNGISSNGYVSAIAVNGADVFFAGTFNQAGEQSVNHIARWDGSTWSPLGNGLTNGVNGDVGALTIFRGDLYVGGQFSAAGGVSAPYLARWSAGAWSAVGKAPEQVSSPVNAFGILADRLYVRAGVNQDPSGTRCFSRWNGTVWEDVPAITNYFGCPIRAIATSGSSLYVGGGFSTIGNAIGNAPANNVARLNSGNWSALGVGVGQNSVRGVSTMLTIGNEIYFAGEFNSAGGQVSTKIAKWTPELLFADGAEDLR